MSERAYVLIKAEKGHEDTAVAELVGKQGLVAVDHVFGQYDIVAVIEAGNLDGLVRIVGNDIAAADHVVRTETLLVTSRINPQPKS